MRNTDMAFGTVRFLLRSFFSPDFSKDIFISLS